MAAGAPSLRGSLAPTSCPVAGFTRMICEVPSWLVRGCMLLPCVHKSKQHSLAQRMSQTSQVRAEDVKVPSPRDSKQEVVTI